MCLRGSRVPWYHLRCCCLLGVTPKYGEGNCSLVWQQSWPRDQAMVSHVTPAGASEPFLCHQTAQQSTVEMPSAARGMPAACLGGRPPLLPCQALLPLLPEQLEVLRQHQCVTERKPDTTEHLWCSKILWMPWENRLATFSFSGTSTRSLFSLPGTPGTLATGDHRRPPTQQLR